jgi:hypothetical protein
MEGGIEEYARDYLRKKGWDETYLFKLGRERMAGLASARINRDSWIIELILNEDFESMQRSIAESAGIRFADLERKVVSMLLDHEHGHWRACPMDIGFLERILDGVSEGLEAAGFAKEEIEQATPEVSNMFMDAVVNGGKMLRRDGDSFAEGLFTFYTDEAYKATLSGGQRKGGPSYMDYYALFVDSQMKMAKGEEAGLLDSLGNAGRRILGKPEKIASMRGMAQAYCANYRKKINGPSQTLLASLIGKELAEKAFRGKLSSDEDRRRALETLGDKRRWNSASRAYAKVMGPFIKDKESQQDARERIPKNELLRRFVEGGGGSPKKERANCGGGEESACDAGRKEPSEGDREFREAVISLGSRLGSRMSYVNRFESLDGAYRDRAERIVVEFTGRQAPERTMPLFNMRRRALGKDEPIPTNIDWSRTLFPKDGDPKLFVRELPFKIPKHAKEEAGQYEDLLLLIDFSGSMTWNGKALDGSKYDLCLRSAYATVKFLEDSGKAPFMQYALLQFSDRTNWTGWKEYKDLDELKDTLLSEHGGSATLLDPAAVERAGAESRGNFLALLITDGQIQNAQEALEACTELIRKGNDVALINIVGAGERMCGFEKAMESAGAIVKCVNKPEDLVGIVLNIVHDRYAPSMPIAGVTQKDAESGRSRVVVR